MIALFGCNSMSTMVDLLFSPVLHNHPKLKIGLSEGGIGWIPYILERSNMTWERHRARVDKVLRGDAAVHLERLCDLVQAARTA